VEFENDPIKAAANIAKHKVSFEEAAPVFGDPLSWRRALAYVWPIRSWKSAFGYLYSSAQQISDHQCASSNKA
jgi:uncharacterized DUF497 family protein